jgi:hypothetical protein
MPGAADAFVLLDDGERQAGLLQSDACEQSRFAATDDHDVPVSTRPRLGWASRPFVDAIEFHLLEEHRDVLVGHRFADQPLIISFSSARPTGAGSGQPRSR